MPRAAGAKRSQQKPNASEEQIWLKHYDSFVPSHLSYPEIPLYQLLNETAARSPQKTCLQFFGKRWSYQQIKARSDAFALGVRDFGVKPGDPVVLLLPNCPQFVIAYYGLLKAGAIIVPLNPLYTERELTFQFNNSQAETVITIPNFLEKVLSIRAKTSIRRVICTRTSSFLPFPLNLWQTFQEWQMLRPIDKSAWTDFNALLASQVPTDYKPVSIEASDPAVILYSGGTTGVAKGIVLSHFNIVANAHQVAAWGNLDEAERMLAVLPLFHGFGMSVNMNAPILGGGEIVLVPRFDAETILKLIEKTKPTFFIGVPTMFVAFSNLPNVQDYDLSSLKGIFVGAAPLSRAIKDEFETKTKGRMIEGYGLTEAVTAIMANPYKGKHKLGSIGIPFPDVDVKIVSLEDEHDLPANELGEIVLKSPTVMKGYLNKPEATKETLKDGWLFTGDIGYQDEEGYFYITDRKKELIIVGGFNVFPREIDELIYAHPKVEEGITVGIPDRYKGEKIKTFIVLKEGKKATEEEFITYFRKRLTPYKVPSEVEFRSSLPKSMIGKILRRKLREQEVAKMAQNL